MTLEPMLHQLTSDLSSALSDVWDASGAAEWLPLVAIWGLGLSAVEGVEHLVLSSSETRQPVRSP